VITHTGKGHITVEGPGEPPHSEWCDFTLEFDPAHPAAVRLVVGDRPWVFARELLDDAAAPLDLRAGHAYRSNGVGDVRMQRTLSALAIIVGVRPSIGRIVFPAQVAAQFMAEVNAAVPLESVAYDVDSWLADAGFA
jgi:hypothetical protein